MAAEPTGRADANPQDIDKVDFVLPDGTPQKMTIGDYRQLSDALFHAGTNSGSQFEYVNQANRLHFYVLDLKRDSKGVLPYTVAIRSLDGAGPQRRGVKVDSTAKTGQATNVVVWAKAAPGAQRKAKLTLTGTSESDPSKSGYGTCRLP